VHDVIAIDYFLAFNGFMLFYSVACCLSIHGCRSMGGQGDICPLYFISGGDALCFVPRTFWG